MGCVVVGVSRRRRMLGGGHLEGCENLGRGQMTFGVVLTVMRCERRGIGVELYSVIGFFLFFLFIDRVKWNRFFSLFQWWNE